VSYTLLLLLIVFEYANIWNFIVIIILSVTRPCDLLHFLAIMSVVFQYFSLDLYAIICLGILFYIHLTCCF